MRGKLIFIAVALLVPSWCTKVSSLQQT